MELKVYRENYKFDRWSYLDPFKEEEIKVANVKWVSYLKENYNLEPIEVWNIVNGFDKDYRRRCKYCNSLTRWTNHKGYSSVCQDKECRKRHDSERCSSTLKKLWKTEEYYNSRKELFQKAVKHMTEVAWSDPEFRKRKSKQFTEELIKWGKNPEIRSKCNRATFISRVPEGKECYFYVGCTEEGFKYGITSNYSFRTKDAGIKSPHKLAKGYKYYISELEYLVKLNFPEASEYRPFTELRKFFTSFKKAVQRLSETGVHPLGMEIPHPDNDQVKI